jgi:uncharacterized protein (DUF58 family)
MALRDRMRQRVANWARRRQGPDDPPFVLQSRRLYILPTRAGAAFALLLFLMLLAGLNYNSSLALFLSFVLAGLGLVALHDCHRALTDLRIARVQADAAFAGQRGTLRVWIENPTTLPRRLLRIRHPGETMTAFALAAGERSEVALTYPAGRRGRQRIERIEIQSRGPLPFFRAWSWLHMPLDAMIYPRPHRYRVLPPPAATRSSGATARSSGADEEWAWLRPYSASDSPRRVAWKVFARGAPLLVAHYDAPAADERLFDFDTLAGLELEQRLSQLAEWILECERRGEPYGLRLRTQRIPLGLGAEQRRRCLEALALFTPGREARAPGGAK